MRLLGTGMRLCSAGSGPEDAGMKGVGAQARPFGSQMRALGALMRPLVSAPLVTSTGPAGRRER